MKEFRDKQRFKNALYSIPSLLVMAAVVFLLARGAGNIFAKERESARVLDDLKEKNATLLAEAEGLKDEVARLHTDDGVIDEIRTKFNVARPGEHLAIVVEDEPKATSTETGALARLKRGWDWLLSLWGQ